MELQMEYFCPASFLFGFSRWLTVLSHISALACEIQNMHGVGVQLLVGVGIVDAAQ